jgi:hypothetical protein
MLYPRTILFRLSFAALVVLSIQLSLSISPLLSQDITIGTQVWTTKNLDVSTFRNGDAIREAKNEKEWKKANKNKTPVFCYYDYKNKNGKEYGKLYNWYAVNDPRGLAPIGYHIPSDIEWKQLTDFLGDADINSVGFEGQLCGKLGSLGFFEDLFMSGYWWSSSESSEDDAWFRASFSDSDEVYRDDYNKNSCLSVRCLKD